MSDSIVLKRSGQRASEPFDVDKLRDSIRSACLSVRLTDGVADDTAQRTTAIVEQWLEGRPEVTSDDIRRVATDALTRVSPEASYLYQHHKSII